MFYKDKRVLVTGGTGFMGTHFVEALAREGAVVRVPVHERPVLVRRDSVEAVRADLTQPDDCLSVCRDVQYVVHAAGAVGSALTSTTRPMANIATNLVITTRMLEAAWAAGVERFLALSSSTVYPAIDRPVKEDDAWTGPPHPSYAGYGWMKRSLERLAEFVASKSSLKVAVVRPTAVYGRYDNFDPVTGHVIPALIRKAVTGMEPFEVWGSGDEVRDFVHVTDVVRGGLRALETHADCDPINLGSGHASTIRNLVHIVLKAAGREHARVEFDPSKPTTIPFRMVDISKARQLLGWEPEVSLEEGVTDTVRWFRESAQI